MAYTLFKQADECAVSAIAREQQRCGAAYIDGRIRKRGRGRSLYVWVETPEGQERRRRSREVTDVF